MELKGLTSREVEERVNNGLVNTINTGHTKTIKEILVNRSNKVKVYRGLLIEKDYDNVKYMKYNLLDRNSWTLSFKVAVVYADKPYLNKEGIVISMDCCIDSINIPLSVWLYGRWLCNENKEMTSPPRGRLKGVEKYQKTSRRHRWKEAAATHERNDGKAMDCRQHFQNRD